MLRPTTIPIEQSNIALFGSDIEKKIKEAAAKGENAWATVGRNAGLFIWRIEKFTVKPWPESELGKFYNGDSYIVLHSYTREDGSGLGHDVHFWLGKDTTQDEYGTAAYKTVELDDYLSGAAVQHREVQEHESDLFLSYFPNRQLEILQGGIDSGFRHVEAAKYQPRLLHLKGRQNVRVVQVPLSADSLNSGDVFVLDNGMTIYQWNGKDANFNEKCRAGQLVRATRDERGGKPEALMYSEGDADAGPFWTLLGGQKPVTSTAAGGSDDAAAQEALASIKMFRLSDSSGSLTFTKVAEGALKKSMLESSDVFVIDNGSHIFTFVGKKASLNEKKMALQYAQKYLTDNGRPSYLPISRVVEGSNNDLFNSVFSDGVQSRSLSRGMDTHPCCPHYPSGGAGSKWAFKSTESPVVSAMFNAFQQPPQFSQPPPQQYGQPPQQYGAPPQQQYGAPQYGYGQPAGGYGAPPPAQRQDVVKEVFSFFKQLRI